MRQQQRGKDAPPEAVAQAPFDHTAHPLAGPPLLRLDADVTGGASLGHRPPSHGLQVVVLPGLAAHADGHHGRVVQGSPNMGSHLQLDRNVTCAIIRR